MKTHRTRNGKIHEGDCLSVLPQLPAKSAHCVVTSPPYYALRDYQMEQQIGMESSPAEYVARMVEVFRGIRHVLRDDGCVWLNVGDSYSAGKSGRDDSGDKGRFADPRIDPKPRKTEGIANGNLLGIPWRLAFALQDDGWFLRQDIIWAKPNPMPESVTNRCTKAHEYVFLLTKKAQYYFDNVAIQERSIDPESHKGRNKRNHDKFVGHYGSETRAGFASIMAGTKYEDRNKRSVWTIPTAPYKEAHFAVFPPALVLPCVLAGTSAKGCCADCGAPWRRVLAKERRATRPGRDTKVTGNGMVDGNRDPERHVTETKTVGWQPTCECHGKLVKKKVKTSRRIVDSAAGKNQDRLDLKFHSNKTTLKAYKNAESHEEEHEETVWEYVSDLPLEDHPRKPCVVLDPFCGSGTTGLVAIRRNRKFVGIELNPRYIQMALKRLGKGEAQRGFGIE